MLFSNQQHREGMLILSIRLRLRSDYSQGQLTDWAGHHIDIAQWGMNTELTAPVEIEGQAVYPIAEDGLYDTPGTYRFECKYKEGFTMIVADNHQNKQGVFFRVLKVGFM